MLYRAGLRRVRDVWPKRAVDFWGRHLVSCKEIPDSTWALIGSHFATHSNADQRARKAATRCVLRTYNAAKCTWGSWESLQRSLKYSSWFWDRFVAVRGRGREEREEEREGVWQEGRGRGGKVNSEVQLEQGRRLAKADPDFVVSNDNLCEN